MQFDPLTEEEMNRVIGLLPEGDYDFEVTDANNKVSKAGNEMIELIIEIRHENNNAAYVFDYLLAAFPHKLRHFAEATGLIDRYNEGLLNAQDCMGKKGRCKIVIQKDKEGIFHDKNSVKDYLISDKVNVDYKTTVQPPAAFDDDVPF